MIYISKGIQTSSVRITKHLGRDKQLKVKIGWEVEEEEFSPLLALIDTGTELCLVNKGLIPKHLFQPAKRRLHLFGANGQVVKGGREPEV